MDATLNAAESGNSHLHPVFQLALAPFAPSPNPAHVFKRIGGTGLDDAKVPTCSCGWKGRPVEGWRDDQSLQLAAQEYQHRMDGVTPQALREGGVL